MKRFILLGSALALSATVARAQSIPNIMAPKRSAQRAVAATNAHTATMTADQGDKKPALTMVERPAGGAVEKSAATDTAKSTATRTVRATAAGTAAKAAPADTGAAFRRETFAYERSGRRDPFVSLMSSGELRPMISDLRLVGVIVDPSGRNSVAVLRDLGTKDQYRVKVGQTLGRMRVASIRTRVVTFTIEEFGYSRQQELTLNDSNQARKK
jgi:Tfp pilus assembly protein PilP